ncbi:MAG TPA: hypothetical protein VF339_16085 [Gammaproteobacteria bacterium]
MAIGIFGLASLQRMPAAPVLSQPLTLGLLLLWAFIAASYVASYRNGTFGEHLASPVGRFAVGTSVAATAVLARMILLGIPDWRSLAALLGLLSAALWIGFLVLAVRSIPTVVARSSAKLVPGVIFLSTVSTQALSLAIMDLFPAQRYAQRVAVGLIALGAACYVVCAALVARSHLRTTGWSLKDDWDNTNCMLHGAMSITGLALVVSGAAPPQAALALWVYVLAVFVAVEAIELARLLSRIRAYGFRRGAMTYRVTQWSRNFTFGMFYAFTLALTMHGGVAEAETLAAVQRAVVAYGPYVVLALLVVEIVVYLDGRVRGRETGLPAART